MKPPLRVPAQNLISGRFGLDAESSHYVCKVHRVRVGDELRLFDPESGREATGTVKSAHPNRVDLDVGELLDAPSVSLPLTLLQALGKGDKPEQSIRDATVLGASKVVLLQTERTVVKVGKNDRSERYRKVAIEAARQSGRSDVPEIEGPVEFTWALQQSRHELKLVCAWHVAARPLLVALSDWNGKRPLALLIGPEGGLSETELEAALREGFAPVSLGPLVLRTETAATVALGVIAAHAALASAQNRT